MLFSPNIHAHFCVCVQARSSSLRVALSAPLPLFASLAYDRLAFALIHSTAMHSSLKPQKGSAAQATITGCVATLDDALRCLNR